MNWGSKNIVKMEINIHEKISEFNSNTGMAYLGSGLHIYNVPGRKLQDVVTCSPKVAYEKAKLIYTELLPHLSECGRYSLGEYLKNLEDDLRRVGVIK